MFFKSKKPKEVLCIYSKGNLLYQGEIKDIPLKESVILQKSVAFFDDPDPCYIHRSAVRVRLTEELLREIQLETSLPHCPLMAEYVDLPLMDAFTFTLEHD